MKKQHVRILSMGFSLMEMMVVLAIMAILAMMAIPSNVGAIHKKQIEKALTIIDNYTQSVETFYRLNGYQFPTSNFEVGMPAPDKLISPYSTQLIMENGAFHLVLGNDAAENLHGKIISMRPLVVKDSPESPMYWACGNQLPPEGMETVGTNLTDVEPISLPLKCR